MKCDDESRKQESKKHVDKAVKESPQKVNSDDKPKVSEPEEEDKNRGAAEIVSERQVE